MICPYLAILPLGGTINVPSRVLAIIRIILRPTCIGYDLRTPTFHDACESSTALGNAESYLINFTHCPELGHLAMANRG